MLNLSPCLEMIWNKLPFDERIDKAHALGFRAYEFWSFGNKDIDMLARKREEFGLVVSACCVDTSFGKDGPGMLQQGAAEPFKKAVADCAALGKRISCKTFIVTTGQALKDVPRDAQHAACVENLKAGARVAEDAGITLVLEPLNILVDHKGYYLATSAEGFQIIDEVGSPAVKLLFDIYHQQITEGNVTRNIEENIGKIGHFHVADNPGRHEPGTGELNYAQIFKHIAKLPYSGHLGLEFSPSNPDKIDDIMKGVQALA